MSLSHRLALLPLLAFPVVLPAPQVWGQSAGQIVIADFEDGVGDWTAVDDGSSRGERAPRCSVTASGQPAPNGGKSSARVEFAAAASGWARLVVPVNGADWAAKGCTKLSFWLRGDGSQEAIRIALRVRGGETGEARETYTVPLKVSGTEWERYSLRFFGFRNTENVSFPSDAIKDVDELQLAKNGSWKAFGFRIDEIVAEGEPGAEAGAVPTTAGNEILPDFAKPTVPMRAQMALDLGAPPSIIDNAAPGVAQGAYAAVADLSPTVVRIKLGDYLDADALRYDVEMFNAHLQWILLSNCKPLICLDVPRTAKDSPYRKQLYTAFIEAVARIVSEGKGGVNRYYELFDEPLKDGVFGSVAHLCESYNSLVRLILDTDPHARVGGPGLALANPRQIEAFLKGAETVHFLSLHFHGSHNALTGSETLFKAACETRPADTVGQLSFQQVKQLVATVRPRGTPEIYITELAMTSAADEAGHCADVRVTGAFGATWVGAVTLCGSPYVDKLFYHKVGGDGWGMVSDGGQPETVYWAMWLLKHYAPRGAGRQQLFRVNEQTIATTVKTGTAYNFIICYGGYDPIEFKVRPLNCPKLKMVRDRYIRDVDRQWMGTTRPTRGEQVVQFSSPGVLVLQYIPAK